MVAVIPGEGVARAGNDHAVTVVGIGIIPGQCVVGGIKINTGLQVAVGTVACQPVPGAAEGVNTVTVIGIAVISDQRIKRTLQIKAIIRVGIAVIPGKRVA